MVSQETFPPSTRRNSLWLPPEMVANKAILPGEKVGNEVAVVVVLGLDIDVGFASGLVVAVGVGTPVTSVIWDVVVQPLKNTRRQAVNATRHTIFFTRLYSLEGLLSFTYTALSTGEQ